MPITLPQLSRREFIKRAALAGALATLAPSSFAGIFGKSRDKNTFFLLSDSHVAADPKTISRNVNMADNFSACVREMASWPVKPAAMIVNGDLALKDGQPGDYATFGKLLLPAGALAPVHLSLGNHDEREHFWATFPQDATRPPKVPAKQCSVFASPRANWFLLDSLEKTDSTPGEIGPEQYDWLQTELASRSDKPAIIVAHHQLNVEKGISGLKDSAGLEEIFTRHPQVKAFIFGHTHNWSIAQHSSGVQLINLPPTAYVFKDGRPSGWVRFSLVHDGMEIELRALDGKHPEHAQVKRLTWRT